MARRSRGGVSITDMSRNPASDILSVRGMGVADIAITSTSYVNTTAIATSRNYDLGGFGNGYATVYVTNANSAAVGDGAVITTRAPSGASCSPWRSVMKTTWPPLAITSLMLEADFSK